MLRILLLIFSAVSCASNKINLLEENCGVLTNEEQLPWEVSIFTKVDGKLSRQGVGALVSNQHVVTLACTVSYKNTTTNTCSLVDINHVKLALGKTQYDDNSREGFVLNEVAKIVAYDEAFDAPQISSLAIIYLKKVAKFSDDILPVCLNLTKSVSRSGLKSLGMSELNDNDDSTQKPIKIDDEKCKIVKESVKNKTDHDYFCITGQERIKYDDFSYVKDNKTGKFYLAEILNSMARFDNGSIDTTSPVFYEDVGNYSKWIEEQIEAKTSNSMKNITDYMKILTFTFVVNFIVLKRRFEI